MAIKQKPKNTVMALREVATGLAQSVVFDVLDYSEGLGILSRAIYNACPSLTHDAVSKLEYDLGCCYANCVEDGLDNERRIEADVWTPEIMKCMALIHGLLRGGGWTAVMNRELSIATTVPYERNVIRISAGRNTADDGWELCVDDLGTTFSATAKEAKFFRRARPDKILSMLHYTLNGSNITVSPAGTLSASFPIDENNQETVVAAFANIKVAIHAFLAAKQNCLDALEVVGVVKPTTSSNITHAEMYEPTP